MTDMPILRWTDSDKESPLRVEELGFNRHYWTSQGQALRDLIVPQHCELVIRKVGHEITVMRRKIIDRPSPALDR